MNHKSCEKVTVAIDKDKGSQFALKWAVDNLLGRGRTITLLHIKQRQPPPIPAYGNDDACKAYKTPNENQVKELFLPFRCFCTRKDIQVQELIYEDNDIPKALCDFVQLYSVENLVLGAPTRNFKAADVPSSVIKMAPDFCNIYVISKGKITQSQTANASIPSGPFRGPIPNQIDSRPTRASPAPERSPFAPRNMNDDMEIKSPFNRGKTNRSYGEFGGLESDISFVSNGRPSTERRFPSPFDEIGMTPPRLSRGSESENRLSFGSPMKEPNSANGVFSAASDDSFGFSGSSSGMDDVEAEMRRLKQELKQTMDMYSTACKEALSAKQKALELQRWKMEEQRRLEEARLAEDAALAIAEREKEKCRVAIEAAQAAQRQAEIEAKKRIDAEMKALKEADEKKKVLDALAHNDLRYRKYSIEDIETATEHFAESRKVGEGGYGPVYKCYLDHTPVAIKVLRPDAAQGRSQFQQEVEVLSCIRHPNMVLLLGACPEYGCLVYEYMANGSLEDRLLRRGNSPVLSWQLRFRIAAEIGTGLLFLHQTKPEPLVHRDLKPGNILLDRNYVSKISDVGLARLVPPSVADTVTQYRMTSTAGTFCYIDPEYQQTGMLGIKSDIYSLGVMLLQIVTGKSPMGLTHHVERAIERGTFAEMLDPAVTDWPVEEALNFAKMALKCAEMRRKDRPDLRAVVLPELNRLRALAEESMPSIAMGGGTSSSYSQVSTPSGSQSEARLQRSGFGNALSHSSIR